ncbi:MAG: major capsid protein [Gammaproteobacteria bacterium]|nr:major capsid protein [Gammaproteobacteria bacterium]
MALPSVTDVQSVDVVLTNLLVAYEQADTRFVASKVFPVVNVEKDSGSYYIFTPKYWHASLMEPRAPGARFPRGDFGVTTGTYATLQFGLEKAIPDEVRANSQLPADLEASAVRWLAQQSLLKKEIAWATDFMITSYWNNTTDGTETGKFSDLIASDPVGDFDTAKRAVNVNTGYIPNTAVMGQIVEDRLRNHPDIIDRLKYVQMATAANLQSGLGAVFGISNWLVSSAMYNSANLGQDASNAAIIDDDLLICYVDPNPGIWTASAGYTFAWSGAGGAGAIDRYRDEPAKSDVVRSQEQWDQAAVADELGYFYLDCTD